MSALFPNVVWSDILTATKETLYMTIITTIFAIIIGLILGIILYLTSNKKQISLRIINGVITILVNTFRSIPFIILIILLIPLTRSLLGTMLGASAALPALIAGSAPFYARLVEMGLKEVDKGVIEAAKAMGATPMQIITKVLIPEAKPALVSGIFVTAITLVGYTALAGIIGAGGLGNLAYYYGYQRTRNDITFVATVCVLIIVFILQFANDLITKLIDKR
jgi:D-methionine transport system permease protein